MCRVVLRSYLHLETMKLPSKRGHPTWLSPVCRAFMLFLMFRVIGAREPEETNELMECTKAAEPLVKNPENIFPLTDRDLARVCSLWRGFQECVQRYTEEHLSEAQRGEFQAAVGGAFQSVDQLCRPDPEHSRAYLENAPCLKRVSLNNSLCGRQYTYLVDLAQGLKANNAQMCCAHLKFRECVIEKTERECDGGHTTPSRRTPSDFMRSMLDRTLGFFLQTCKNYIPNAQDCPRGNYPDGDVNSGNNLGNPNNNNFNPNNNNNNNNNLRPDATTSSTPYTTSFGNSAPSTRFTWTTLRPTTPKLAIAGNLLPGPESSQYKGSGNTVFGVSSSLLIPLCIVLALRLH